MPPQSRSQRRRQSQRAAPRPSRAAGLQDPAELVATPEQGAVELLDRAVEAPRPIPATPPARQARTARRSTARPLEPVDYTQDYAMARRDLIKILIISSLLFVVMLGLGFSGLI